MFKKLLILLFLCAASALHAANYLTFTAEVDNSSLGISEISIEKRNVNVQFSLDGGKTWENLKTDTLISLARKGDKALLRGNNPKGFSSAAYSYTRFVMTGRIAASGSVMSLIDNEGEAMVIPNDMCFRELFMNCTSLIKAPALPAISLKKSCYKGMFNGCSNLTQAPELPADSLTEACYFCMFSGCTSLTKTPVLPATQLAKSCYYSMFSECTKLTQAPELPATQLAEGCYQNMFSGCTKLTKAPALPATELTEDCYTGMFYDCPNLKQYPPMPDLAMIDYYYFKMFLGNPQEVGTLGLTFNPSQIQHANYLTFTAEEDSSSFGIDGGKEPIRAVLPRWRNDMESSREEANDPPTPQRR